MKLPTCLFGFAIALGVAHAVSAADFRVVQRFALGGEGGWDYLALDAAGHRLFLSRGDHVAVIDSTSGKPRGEIAGTDGVHGITLVPELRRGYTSNGHANTLSVFALDSLKPLGTIAVGGQNPDALLYDRASRHLFAFNGHSANASVIDPVAGKEIATLALPGKPEFAVSDGHGKVFVNIEDKSEVVAIDALAAKVSNVWPLAPGEEPTGLAYDAAHRRLFSVCANRKLLVLDAGSGRRVAVLPIGAGPDAAVYDPARGLVYSSNGKDGTLSVIRQDDADHYRVLAQLPTQPSARTMALDPASGRIFLAAAELVPAPAGAPPHGRPAAVEGSFSVLVVAGTTP